MKPLNKPQRSALAKFHERDLVSAQTLGISLRVLEALLSRGLLMSHTPLENGCNPRRDVRWALTSAGRIARAELLK